MKRAMVYVMLLTFAMCVISLPSVEAKSHLRSTAHKTEIKSRLSKFYEKAHPKTRYSQKYSKVHKTNK